MCTVDRMPAKAVVGHLCGGDGAGVESAQLGDSCAQISGEAVGVRRGNTSSAESKARLRWSAKRSPGTRVPVAVVRVPVMACSAWVPVMGSQLSRWTCSRRRAVEPISRSAGRLVSRSRSPNRGCR